MVTIAGSSERWNPRVDERRHEQVFGREDACCPSVASLAWSLAVAGMPGSAGVFRVLARVSGIGGECFSWMGGGSSAVTGLLLI